MEKTNFKICVVFFSQSKCSVFFVWKMDGILVLFEFKRQFFRVDLLWGGLKTCSSPILVSSVLHKKKLLGRLEDVPHPVTVANEDL